jgi:hypothetical protein
MLHIAQLTSSIEREKRGIKMKLGKKKEEERCTALL